MISTVEDIAVKCPSSVRRSRAYPEGALWRQKSRRSEIAQHILELLTVNDTMDSHRIARVTHHSHNATLMALARMERQYLVRRLARGKRGIGIHGASTWSLRHHPF